MPPTRKGSDVVQAEKEAVQQEKTDKQARRANAIVGAAAAEDDLQRQDIEKESRVIGPTTTMTTEMPRATRPRPSKSVSQEGQRDDDLDRK